MSKWVSLISGAFMTTCAATATFAQGIPVIDAQNVIQSTITAMEDIAQSATLLDQYTTQLLQYNNQLEQYQNMVMNTQEIQAALRIYNAASTTYDKMNKVLNFLDRQKEELGDMDAMLSQLTDVRGFLNGAGSSCLGTGCQAALDQRLKGVNERRRYQTDVQSKANTALLRGADEQSANVKEDTKTLERLQESMQAARGQVAVAQANGQIAAAAVDQMTKIRSLLIAQMSAQAVRDQSAVDQKAQESQTSQELRAGTFDKPAGKSW
ncbi:P-type conjugative transfer protein TrbJ [Azospirillum brasilense]|nr:P-type conjugative transfer protein TrbJ [Azospirillum brasilense]